MRPLDGLSKRALDPLAGLAAGRVWSFGHPDLDAYTLTSAWNYDPADSLTDKVGSNNGTNFGTTDVAGKNGRGRRLVEASTQHMDFGNGNNLAPTTGFTVAKWVKFVDVGAGSHALMGKHDNNAKRSYLIFAISTNAFRAIISSDGSNAVGSRSLMTTNNNVIVPGSWQLVIFSFDTTTKIIKIYVDSVDESQSGDENAASIHTAADVSFAVGATHATGTPVNFLNADVDEGWFWRNQILNAAARSALWNSGAGRFITLR